MKQVRIPGSKFKLSLEDEQNQWVLRLRIHNAVEEEVPLTHLDNKAVKLNIEDLLDSAHLNLPDIQIKLIHEEIWDFIQKRLTNQEKKRKFGVIEDDRVSGLVNRIDKLTEGIEKLEKKLSSLESKI